jgi:hypothetical protein
MTLAEIEKKEIQAATEIKEKLQESLLQDGTQAYALGNFELAAEKLAQAVEIQ